MPGLPLSSRALRQPAGCEIASLVSLSVVYDNILNRDAIYPRADHSVICKRAVKHETSTFDTLRGEHVAVLCRERAVLRKVECSACAELMCDRKGSRRARVRCGG